MDKNDYVKKMQQIIDKEIENGVKCKNRRQCLTKLKAF